MLIIRMKILSALTLFLAVYITSASARVGENETELQARYGEPVGNIPTEDLGPMRGFKSGGYIIGVVLENGVSEMEMFSKADEANMTASEIQNLLKGNGAGEWKAEQTGKPNWRRWRREDDAQVGLYDASRHFLYISSKKFYEEKGKNMEKREPGKAKEPA
jgi:hypothetical protein